MNDFIRSYHIPGCPNYMRRPKNAIYLNPGSTLRHEMSKALGAYMLQKWGDIQYSKTISNYLKLLEEEVNMLFSGNPKEKADFITEAVPNNQKDRRIDLVRLKDDVRFEFETNHKIKKTDPEKTVVTIHI
jgi:hypothetical protein